MLKKLTCGLIVLLTIGKASAQDLRINIFGGLANYNGDLQSKPITFQQARYAVGTWLSYDLNPKLMLRAGIHFAAVQAADRYQQNPQNQVRNLSFASNILELHTGVEYHFLGMDQRVFSPYLFGGIAAFHYNPYALDAAGNKVFLKPLSTEGQGIAGYPDRKPYSLMQMSVPLGIGVRMVLNDQMDLGLEFGYRKSFTDYMDDVSRSYIDQTILLTQKGPTAVSMAYRTPELPNHSTDPYPVNLEKRGNSALKDNYYFFGLHFSYRLTGGDKGSNGSFGNAGRKGGKKRSKMGCPTNVL